ncbi:MAG: hypothetical protein ACXWR1_22345, partial [Bdellovibrionota bacterium]
LVLVRAELQGAPSLLVQCRRLFAKDGRKIVLASSEWSKEQFRMHSKTDGAAHRYARVPMPPEGFLNLVSDLFGCAVDELADFDLVPEEGETSSEAAVSSVPESASVSKAPKKRKVALRGEDTGDMDVLRKYLAIREEQLELAEGEREELSRENERLQKEAHQLQLRLREFEHLQDELQKKVEQMEEDKAESERKVHYSSEESERASKIAQERVKNLESQISEAGEKYENLRARVRKDIRKIRENERDLEARLELMRRDSETLLSARDVKVLELQRKIDALEFDLDQVQDSRVQAQMEAERYLAKLSRVSRALQIANSMIEDDRAGEAELEELEPLVGGAANAEEPAEGGSASAPAAAEAPPAEGESAAEAMSPELTALASEGEPTQMISAESLKNAGGESGSSSG